MSKGSTGQIIKGMVATIVVFEIICLSLGFSLGVVSSVLDLSDLCFKRYSFDSMNSNSVVSNVGLKANANYTIAESNQGSAIIADPATAGYGKWKKANFQIKKNQLLQMKAVGEISLCRSYLPKYHLQERGPIANTGGIYHQKSNGDRIPIPRISENVDPFVLIFDARTKGWRNLVEVYNGDILKVILDDNVSPSQVIMPDRTTIPVSADDCRSLSDPVDRQNCLNAIGSRDPTDVDPATCANITDSTQRSACEAQFGANPPEPKGLTEEECKRMPPNLVDQCMKTTHKAVGRPRPPPKPAAPTGQNVNVVAYTVTDSVTKTPTVANCSQNYRTYSPICGRYSLWNGTSIYHVNCACGNHESRCAKYECGRRCSNGKPIVKCFKCDEVPIYCPYACRKCGTAIMPETYLDNGLRTKSRFVNQNFMLQDYSRDPAGSYTRCDIEPSYPSKFWFSAKDAAGLQYRFHNQVYPGSAALGGNYQWASIVDPKEDVYSDQYDGRKIYSDQFDAVPFSYLQYRFHGADYSNTQTGGYVLKMLHTKCRRVNGNYLTDTMENRGAVEYLILQPGEDPNKNPALAESPKMLKFTNGLTNFNSGSNEGYMWLKIKNNMADYPDSVGTYRITMETQVNNGTFTLQILNPLFKIFRDKIYEMAMGTFKKITCFETRFTDSCINFFNYIRALLTLYIMFLGFRFILGADIKQDELIKSIIKVTILIGLMNGGTFTMFREYVFPIVTGFSDQIIANMSGFSMISSTNSVENPFMFLDALMSKMFLNPTFLYQLLTTMAMGITGIFYFILICVSVVVFVIATFRAMAIYIMALLATALLIGLAPIFISFLLFERTYYLFENWAKFTFRYMMEPVIVMAGIIILTQLFTLYIDQVLSFSLCWKCALPFKIPFASLLPFPGLANIPLFCIYWFSPWGLDPVNDPMGMDLSMIVGLAMVAYSAYGYVEFAGKIAHRLVGGSGGPSSISLGSAMNKDFGNKVQEQALLAQDKYAKTLGSKGGGGKGSGPTRGAPSMGLKGDSDGSGGSEDGSASGALKSNRAGGGAGATDSAVSDLIDSTSSAASSGADPSIESSPASTGGDSSVDSGGAASSGGGASERAGTESAAGASDSSAEGSASSQESGASGQAASQSGDAAMGAAAADSAISGGAEAASGEAASSAGESAEGAGKAKAKGGAEGEAGEAEKGQTTQEYLDSFDRTGREEIDTKAADETLKKGPGKGQMDND